MADRVHASAIRSKLLQLRQTSDPSLKRQTSVAAGKNANSARDKRVNVLTAGDLALRIHDLSAMIEKLAMAIDAIQAADQSISAITELVRVAQALVRRAQEATDVTVRTTLAGQFDALLPEIDLLAGRANVNGFSLLGGNDLTISLSGDVMAAVTVASFNDAATGDLAIKPSQKNWATIADIDLAAAEVKLATVVLRSQAQALRELHFGSSALAGPHCRSVRISLRQWSTHCRQVGTISRLPIAAKNVPTCSPCKGDSIYRPQHFLWRPKRGKTCCGCFRYQNKAWSGSPLTEMGSGIEWLLRSSLKPANVSFSAIASSPTAPNAFNCSSRAMRRFCEKKTS